MKLGKIVLAAGTRRPATSTGSGTASGNRTRRVCVSVLKGLILYVLIVLSLLTAFWLEGRLLLETLP